MASLIAEYRSFGGEKYEYRSGYRTKREAKAEATKLREKGNPTRVVPMPNISNITSAKPKYNWLVYTRWTMPKRGR